MRACLKGFSKQNFEKFPAFLLRKKGISPIVASVLLIAFSTAIAAVVGTWAMDYSTVQLSNLESCRNAEILYSNFEFDSSTGEGTLILQNIGIPIKGYKIYAFAENNQKELVKEVEVSLKKSEKRTEKFGTDINNIKGLIVEVANCPGIRLIIPIS